MFNYQCSATWVTEGIREWNVSIAVFTSSIRLPVKANFINFRKRHRLHVNVLHYFLIVLLSNMLPKDRSVNWVFLYGNELCFVVCFTSHLSWLIIHLFCLYVRLYMPFLVIECFICSGLRECHAWPLDCEKILEVLSYPSVSYYINLSTLLF